MKTLYEINWHYKDDAKTKFSHCTVTPIEVLLGGILLRDYFETEAQAWAQARQYLRDTMKKNDEVVAAINAETDCIFSFLVTLPPLKD